MDTVKTRVNWSAVVRDAVERKLEDIQRLESVTVNKSLVERLRESKAKFEQDEQANGWEVGKQWAESAAEYGDLVRLSSLAPALTNDPYVELDPLGVYAAIFPDDGPDRTSSEEFWKEYSGAETAYPTSDWLRGFVAGSAEVFQQVEDDL
ncbi:hypothetical protein Pan216_16050 [Planctomycetes bacterium Pan216]|uniref:Uncharacterized protein n=1 Tax=Kolteria novifilia TaxID=2527975 RepID=A0A518B1A2_9BACT|nr:hypothetical protein Pan216_16050 [Planctomycetes bacterium Pan216]